MTVQNKYVSALLAAGKLENAALGAGGARTITMVATEEIATTTTDEILSVYRFFQVSGNLIPVKIEVYGDAAIVALQMDVGLYEQTPFGGADGPVIDRDIFGSAIDIDGITTSTAPIDGMENLDIANRTKKIYEHAAHTVLTSKAGYDIALTSTTAATTGGTVTVVATFVEG